MISHTPLLPSLRRASRCERGKHMRMGEVVTMHVSPMKASMSSIVSLMKVAVPIVSHTKY